MSELPFKFPVLGFARPLPGEAGERLQGFLTPDKIKICGRWSVENKYLIGMRLVDSKWRSWEIVDATYQQQPRKGLLNWLFRVQPDFDVQLVTEPRPEMSLDEVKAGVCAAIDADPDRWYDEELRAGESGPPVETPEQLERLKKKVRSAKTLSRILSILDLEDPPD